METITVDLPTMYGDHHVAEVRRILLAMPGVEDVYASSAFHVVRARVDPAQVSEADLRAKLSEAGYLGEMLPRDRSLEDRHAQRYRGQPIPPHLGVRAGEARRLCAERRALWSGAVAVPRYGPDQDHGGGIDHA